MATSIVDLSQINIEELIRDVEEKKTMRLLKQIIKNNKMILKLQKTSSRVVRSREEEKKKRIGKRMEEKRIS